MVHICNKPSLVTAPLYDVCIKFGTKSFISYSFHCEGHVPRKLLIRNNGNFSYQHRSQG